jgi:hypothetical protein
VHLGDHALGIELDAGARLVAGWATSATGCSASVATRMRPSSLACLFMIERLLSDVGTALTFIQQRSDCQREISRLRVFEWRARVSRPTLVGMQKRARHGA